MPSTIKTKNSTTASATPTGLVQGELAVNITDKKLYVGDASGNSIQIAGQGATNGAGGSNTQVQFNSSGALAGSSNMTFDGTSLTLGGNPTLSGGTANGVAYLNGSKVLTTGSALVFDGSNLGIGTSSPGYRFNATKNGAACVAAAVSDTQSTIRAECGSVAVDLNTTGSTGEVRTATNHPLVFGTNAIERMRLDSSGNLGLGVTPSAWSQGKAIEVFQPGFGVWNGTASSYLLANAYFNGGFKYGVTGQQASHYYQYQGSHVWSNAPSGTAGNAITFTQAMTLDASGNLGIGITSPTARIDLSGTHRVQIRLEDTVPEIRAITPNGSAFKELALNGLDLRFNTSNTERMRIDSSGNVGIGTSSPSYKLDVAGATQVNSNAFGAQGGYYLNSGANANARRWLISNDVNAFGDFVIATSTTQTGSPTTQRLIIDSNGNLLVNTTSAIGTGFSIQTSSQQQIWMRNSAQPSGQYVRMGVESSSGTFTIYTDTSGGVYMTRGATSWTGNSDERLKTDLVPIQNALGKVEAIRAVTGRFKTDEEGVSRSFLIAQDLQAVFPEVVDVKDDEMGTLGIRYTDTIPLLVAAIKEQQAIINDLTNRLTALENK